ILRTSQGAALAVIDGQRLRVGDALGGARLLAIYPRTVLIERQGQRHTLRLAEPIVKPSR
ncbi:MAG: Type II secretory pathway component, partial [Pseudomonas sp.]